MPELKRRLRYTSASYAQPCEESRIRGLPRSDWIHPHQSGSQQFRAALRLRIRRTGGKTVVRGRLRHVFGRRLPF